MKQTILPLGDGLNHSFDNFIEHDGTGHIRQSLCQFLTDEARSQKPVFYIWGEEGVGKSHLLEGAACFGRDGGLAVIQMALNAETPAPDNSELLQMGNAVVLFDAIDRVIHNEAWCATIMQLFDATTLSGQDTAARLVFTATVPPNHLQAARPDVVSRLSIGEVWGIHPPSEHELKKILTTHATERGFELTDRSLDYMLRHCPRNLSALFGVVARIEEVSLLERRKPGFHLVSRIVRERTEGE